MKITKNNLFNVKTYESYEKDKRVYGGTVMKAEAIRLPDNESYYKLTIQCDYNLKSVSFKLNRGEMQHYYPLLCVGIGIQIITQKIDGKWKIVKMKEMNKVEDRAICLDQSLFLDEV